MDVFECIKSRRSVRRYLDKDIPNSLIYDIVEAASHAPYGGPPKIEGQLWDFIVIRNKKRKTKLALGYEDRQWIIDAPVIIACLADMSCDIKYKNWEIVMGLAMENLILAAQAKGLGTCIVSAFSRNDIKALDRAELRNILRVPLSYDLCALITVGYPDPDEKIEHKPIRETDDMIRWEKW